ncbi:MAG: hypothetical protein AAFW68_13280 [Pseudomonadota bacterium]
MITKIALATAAASISLMSYSSANAAPICMSKKPADAARLSVGMGPQDVSIFTAAGWTNVDCPPTEVRIFGGAEALCTRFNAYSPEQQYSFQTRYGVTVAQLCTAAHNYETEQAEE